MERDQNGLLGNNNPPFLDSVLSSNLFLDHCGEVVLTSNNDGLSWKLLDPLYNEEEHVCWGFKIDSEGETEVKFSDVYAVGLIGGGSEHELGQLSKMYRFRVHAVQKSKTHSSLWTPSSFTFIHKDLEICRTWVSHISSCINAEAKRPKGLLVFVNPRSGKGHGCKIWETVAPLFTHAKVKTKVLVTERAGHAHDVLASMTNKELSSWNGVVAVGGDGFFNEILNAVLLPRHKAPYPPAPGDSLNPVKGSEINGTDSTNCEQDHPFSFPNDTFRFGIIPAGSTDAITICTTGARDPITSALHIILGKKVHLDLAQLVRWKTTPASNVEPCVRYAASFAGYGFYGDVMTESEKYRWMGPKRYDYAGTKVFLQHKSYEAEVKYVEVEQESDFSNPESDAHVGRRKRWRVRKKPDRVSCRANCSICNSSEIESTSSTPNLEGVKWLSCKGRFLSVGAAVISCRNEKAPDGLIADAHLSDGFMHLILIKDCPHPLYLWHLIQLTKKGGTPLDFNFVEHHKTPAFTFESSGKGGVWNVDGEIFVAHQLSAQVFRGLVSLFAAGPDS